MKPVFTRKTMLFVAAVFVCMPQAFSMDFSSPRRFSNAGTPDGRVQTADTYGEVTIYPDGHWKLGTHTSIAGGAKIGSCVNYSFILRGKDGVELRYPAGRDGVARFGMAAEHSWCVAPAFTGGPADRYDDLSGSIDPAIFPNIDSLSIAVTPSSAPSKLSADYIKSLTKLIGEALAKK